jgi:hypothetical protein
MQRSEHDPGRYVAEETDDGVRIYDSENDDARIRSDATADLSWQT